MKAIVVTDDHITQIEKMAGYGMTEASIAHIIGMDPSTLRAKKQKDTRISSALEKGKATAEGRVSKALYEVALDTTHKGQMTAIIWIEKTRYGRVEPRAETPPTEGLTTEDQGKLKALLVELEKRMGEQTVGESSGSGCVQGPEKDKPQKTLPTGRDIP